MDTKRLLSTILIAGALFLAWQLFFNKGGGAAPATKSPFALYTAAATQPLVEIDTRPQTIELGDAFTPVDKAGGTGTRVKLTIDNVTAGIAHAYLNKNDYAETVKREQPLTLFQAEEGLARPFSTTAIKVWIGDAANSLDYDQQYVWGIKDKDSQHVTLNLVLTTRDVPATGAAPATRDAAANAPRIPLAEITKTFRIEPNSYEVKISHAVKNLTDKPLKVEIDQLGSGELYRDDPQADDRYFHAIGLDSTKNILELGRFNATPIDAIKFADGTKEIGQLGDFKNSPVLWVSASNRFFSTILRPLPMPNQAATVTTTNSHIINEVTHVARANLDLMKYSDKSADSRSIVRLTGSVLGVGPGDTITEPLTVYMGPKKRDILDGNLSAPLTTEEYAHASYAYTTVIQLSQGGCYAYCTFEPIAIGILWLLNLLVHSVAFGNWGVAIMILVILVRAALHPLTRSSQINMAVMSKKMKDVQPLLEASKKKYANNKQKQNEEMMRIYKEHNVNPAGGILGCLPMLIQMPIWAALWSGLRTDIDLRHQPFIPGWINDLSHPDTVFPTNIPVIGHPLFTVPLLGDIYGLNLLPILLTAVFFFQMKVTTASQPKPADEQQAQMQKMSQYMIFIFPLFLYSAPSGLNLYIFASTLGGLVDTWLVRNTLKARGILPATAQALPTHEE